jgi:hypothetical protein
MLPGVDAIASRIEQQLTPRAVVLVHDGGGNREQTYQALKKVIPDLLSGGWTFDFPATTVHAHAPAASTSASATATSTVPQTPIDAGTPSPEAPENGGKPAQPDRPGKTPDPVLTDAAGQ